MIHIGKKHFACEYCDNKFHTITENMKEFKYCVKRNSDNHGK